ncbi:MAG: Gfo/Idh/MocA family oxidoreductase [Candidatus Brocadiia bacterium]
MGISVGMVGLGSFGSQFAPLFKAHPHVDRIALCDREPERVAKFAERDFFQDKFDPSDAFYSLEDICEADLDALVIITQPWLHAAQCIQAMESGKHVYSAVPIVSLPDADEILDWCDRLVQTCTRTGMIYMLGETTYYRPQTMYCRRRAEAGDFGEFVHADAQYFHDVDDPGCNLRDVYRHRTASTAGQQWKEQAAERYQGTWGGPMHYPTHSVSGPVSVMGAHVTRVTAHGQKDETGDPFFEHGFRNEAAFFEMSNGATARVAECRRIGHTGEEMFRVFGTEGSFREDNWVTKEGWENLQVDQMRDPLPEEVADAYGLSTGESAAYGGHGGSHPYLVNEFCHAVAEGRQPAVNVWEAVRYMAPGVMAHKSALRDGEPLEVPDWGDAPT